MRIHLGQNGVRLCGESYLTIGECSMDTNLVSCIPCLWAGAAQLHAQQSAMLGALKREVDRLAIEGKQAERD